MQSDVGSHHPFSRIDRTIGHHRPLVERVLLMDDDRTERQRIAKYFTQHDMRVSERFGCKNTIQCIVTGGFSLVILDRQLDQENDLLRQIRAKSDVPVILTTANRSETDLVAALEFGADDYLVKPVAPRELLARARAVLRRQKAARASNRDLEPRRYYFGNWQLDRCTRTLTSLDGVPVVLTKAEYTLLLAFLAAPRRPLSRDYLKLATRKHGDIADRSIDVQVRRLRYKLEAEEKPQRIIRTEQGIGYMFALRVVLS